jgi:SecD/SecF fusion protein
MTIQEIDSEIVPYVEGITGDGNVQVQKIEGTTQVNIKTRALDEAERASFNDVLTEQFGVEEQTITSETISATISGEMRREAIVAVLVAVAFMLLYIWLRFSDIRFGFSSVAALLHDVLIVLTFYAIARVSVGSTFIACMLTIVGYSINATIVIFDRVRENKKAAMDQVVAASAKRRKKKKSDEKNEDGENDIINLKEIVNKSISQTLSRSILTSITTLVMVVCLYIMGVSSIKEFALPLIVGIIAGGYSSVFIAGIVWRFLRIKFVPKYEDEDD